MDCDKLLAEVMAQARALNIPIAEGIDPHVQYNHRATGRFGCCIRRGEGYTIQLSQYLEGAPRLFSMGTLAHEVLHTCWGCRNHAARWKAYAARMNEAYGYHISRTSTWEDAGLPSPKPVRYLLRCQRCGAEFPRSRACQLVQHPERYHCRCGGEIAAAPGEREA